MLSAVIDLRKSENVSINILTHMKSPVVRGLVASGSSFDEANVEAERLVLENYGIYNGSIKSVGTILEGTDGVGKSTTIESLIKEGIICRDREMEIFSKNMMFEIPMSLRANIYNEYLKNHKDLVIFLINKDKEELERRINSRNHISEFDLEAYRYNKLYLDTYLYMIENNLTEDKLKLFDATGLTEKEQKEGVKKLILERK